MPLPSNSSIFKGPLFIIGMPRSGTKLLRDLLNRHPAISTPTAETLFLPMWSEKWGRTNSLTDPATFSEFYKEAVRLPFVEYMRRAGYVFIKEQEWYSSTPGYNISQLFETLIRYYVNAPEVSDIIWGDKSPSYITQAGLLKQLFPHCKFIHIVRDPRDYCLSCKAAWGKNMIRAAQRWSDNLTRFSADTESFPDDVLELRYEDLLDDPERKLRSICKFLNLEFYPDMLTLSKASENLGDTKGVKNIVHTNKYKYQIKMKKALTRKIEQICLDKLREYNYPFEYNGLSRRVSPYQMFFYRLADGINLVFFRIRKEGLVRGILFQLRLFRFNSS